jgi:hypothetical protein
VDATGSDGVNLISTRRHNNRLKLTRLTRFSWKEQRNFPKFPPSPRQRQAGQLSRKSLGPAPPR